MKDRPNFLLIQLDQLHSRALKAYGGNVEMPNIDGLFREVLHLKAVHVPFPSASHPVQVYGVDVILIKHKYFQMEGNGNASRFPRTFRPWEKFFPWRDMKQYILEKLTMQVP